MEVVSLARGKSAICYRWKVRKEIRHHWCSTEELLSLSAHGERVRTSCSSPRAMQTVHERAQRTWMANVVHNFYIRAGTRLGRSPYFRFPGWLPLSFMSGLRMFALPAVATWRRRQNFIGWAVELHTILHQSIPAYLGSSLHIVNKLIRRGMLNGARTFRGMRYTLVWQLMAVKCMQWARSPCFGPHGKSAMG